MREDQARNHEALLDAAVAIFDVHGLDAPLPMIAEEAGTSVATLYRHFAGRNELLLELYGRHATMLERRVEGALEATRDESVDVQLDAFFDAVIAAMREHACYGALAARAVSLAPPRPVSVGLTAGLGALTADAQEAGVLDDEVTALDLAVLAVSTGIIAGLDSTTEGAIWRRLLQFGRQGMRFESARADAATTS